MNNSVTPVDQLLDLSGKVAIVTGASGGIGGAIALRLAEAGANIAVHFHSDSAQANRVAEIIQHSGANACCVKADLRNEDECNNLLSETVETLGHPDILINNAGTQPVSNLLTMSTVEINDVLTTNVTGPILLTRLFASLHAENSNREGTSSVTNIASIEGLQPAVGHSHYASSKSALIMFTRAAAVELGQYGIRVNAVSPGLINREGLAEDWPDGVNRYHKAAPLSAVGESSDIANAVLFLSSSAARWISGSNLVVDGGVGCVSTW